MDLLTIKDRVNFKADGYHGTVNRSPGKQDENLHQVSVFYRDYKISLIVVRDV